MPLAAAIRQLTTDHSLGLGVDFAEEGNPEKNPRSTEDSGGGRCFILEGLIRQME